MKTVSILCAFVLGLGAGCTFNEQTSDQVSAARGQRLFAQHCQSCHGPSGAGNGRLSAQLSVAPADLTVLSLLNEGQFPDEAVMSEIYGYPGKYHLGLMPEFGPLLQGPLRPWSGPDGEMLMTPQGLLDLVSYLKALQQ